MSRPVEKIELAVLSRRQFVSLAGVIWVAPSIGYAQSPSAWSIDFTRRNLGRASLMRDTAAYGFDGSKYVLEAQNAPRFITANGNCQGLLLEGQAENLLLQSTNLPQRSWESTGGALPRPINSIINPAGVGDGVFELVRSGAGKSWELTTRLSLKPASSLVVSVWLRALDGPSLWHLRLVDSGSYHSEITTVNVDAEWRRFSLCLPGHAADSGQKSFYLALDTPAPATPSDPSDKSWGRDETQGSARVKANHVLVWGPQIEYGRLVSSYIPTQARSVFRAADVLTFAATELSSSRGAVTFTLPNGGARGAVLLDSAGAGNGLQLAYSASGWLVARIAGVECSAFGDVTAARVVRLEWSSSGINLYAGNAEDALTLRGSRKIPLRAMVLAPKVRVGMTETGTRPLNGVIARISFDTRVNEPQQIRLPQFVASPYRLVFADDFNDGNLSRLNETAQKTVADLPAWRSRYRHGRFDVVNGEKQIYVDPAFAGMGDKALGLQPFSMDNGVLGITARRVESRTVTTALREAAFYSGVLTTELTHWQKYGYFEIRAKLPKGKGLWPAFWFYNKHHDNKSEFDFEFSGARPESVHVGVIQNVVPHAGTTGYWVNQIVDTTDDFHYYGVEWSEKAITFFVDGMKCFEYVGHRIHEPMYLLLNLALGSNAPPWIPDPDASTPFPATFLIDYVRAYQKS